MITTCLPAAVIGVSSRSPSWTRLDHGRYSIAWWIPAQLAPGDRQVAPRRRPARHHDGVGGGQQDVDVDAVADGGVGAELGPLGLHLGEAPLEVALLHLELGDAVAQQAADAVGPLEHDDVVAGPRQLLGDGQPGRPGADDGHPLAGLDARDLRA